MKFKVGDKVKLKAFEEGEAKPFPNISLGEIGEIIGLSGVSMFPYHVAWVNLICDKDSRHYSDNFSENELELLTIPDTKIGRNLHKNNILKIEDNKIYLKS